MTAEEMTAAREVVRLCQMRPADAHNQSCALQRDHAMDVAWEHLANALDEVERLQLALDLATGEAARCPRCKKVTYDTLPVRSGFMLRQEFNCCEATR